MVVCKCRKATKLYCFVHKVPVCGECICFPEHQICVVRTYSDWVIDGEYDWPPTCCLCHAILEDGNNPQTTRLGCLHVIHTKCLVSHIKSFPPHTAPAGYVCPMCSTSIWPPKRIKDSGSRLHSKLKEDIMQTGMEKNLFGNHPVSLTATKSHVPLAIASDPLRRIAVSGGTENSNANASDSIKDPTLTSAAVEERNLVEGYSPMTGIGSSKLSATDIVEIDGPSLVGNQFISDHEPNFMKCTSPSGPGATTRKGAYHVDNQSSETQYYADDEDGTRKKYTRRESLGLLRSGDGCFSVKSLTSKLSSTGSANFPCKQIWNPVSPSKSNFLVWTMVLNKCLSKISLERKGLQLLSLLCGLCRLFPESTGHLSIHCPISSRVWEHFLTAAGICWVMPRSVKDLFSWKSACLKERGHLV